MNFLKVEKSFKSYTNEKKGNLAHWFTDGEDYFKDFDNIFDDVGKANWIISKETMNPELKKIPKEFEQTMINSIRNDIDPFIMVGFLYCC